MHAQLISAYPNPAQNHISFVGLSPTEAQTEALVYDATGKVLIRAILNSNELVIAQLPAGNYIAVIKENGKAVYQSRFVKE